jgi:hypothetical protein
VTEEVMMSIVNAALLTLGLAAGFGLGGGIEHAAAQSAATDIAYVESVRGRVVASSRENPTLLEALDTIAEGTQLDLKTDSELQICHHRTGRMLTLRGPLRVSISASGVTPEYIGATKRPPETCVPPVVSTFQGGLITRSTVPMNVALNAGIKVVNRGTPAIRRIALWDGQHQTVLMNFDGNSARPVLKDGENYRLVIERSDGGELNVPLQANAAITMAPMILVIR